VPNCVEAVPDCAVRCTDSDFFSKFNMGIESVEKIAKKFNEKKLSTKK
jgi:hypothetical protein